MSNGALTRAALLRLCGEALAAGHATLTVTLPPEWRRRDVPGFPRFEVLSVTRGGYSNVSIPAAKLVAWLDGIVAE
jgi:hypothetical protein